MEKLNTQCQNGKCENTPGSYKCLENFEFNIRLADINDNDYDGDDDDDEPAEDEDVKNIFCPDGFEYNTTARSCAGIV